MFKPPFVHPFIVSLSKDDTHRFSKTIAPELHLKTNFGIIGDAHAGATVQHLSRIKADAAQPNLRQVHLIAEELFDEMAQHGFTLQAGDLGENILTRGLDLVNLPLDTRIHIGRNAILRITGLRNPCRQIEDFRAGLAKHMVDKDENDRPILKTGIMSTVERGGMIRPNDILRVKIPAQPHQKLERV